MRISGLFFAIICVLYHSIERIDLICPTVFFDIRIGYNVKGGAFMSGYSHGGSGSSGFALIVVLFILLIIVGAAYLC